MAWRTATTLSFPMKKVSNSLLEVKNLSYSAGRKLVRHFFSANSGRSDIQTLFLFKRLGFVFTATVGLPSTGFSLALTATDFSTLI